MDIKEIQAEVYKRRPVLKEIAEKFGGLTLQKYVESWEVRADEPDGLFLEVLNPELVSLYGTVVAEQLIKQLKSKPLVSTIDHLGLWSHPFFVNSDLIFSLGLKKEEVGLVLATEGVSLNNSTSRSASFFYHENGELTHHSFLPHRLANTPAFSSPAIIQGDIERFNKTSGDRFKGLIGELELPSVGDFPSQAAKGSYNLWQKVFPSAPKLAFLPLETTVSKYLLRVLEDENNFISKIILTEEGRQLWQKYFSEEHGGLFWAIDESGKRQKLGNLPDGIALKKLIDIRKIYPSSPLCFVVLMLAGMSCVGGFNQTTWLTEVKEKLLQMKPELKLPPTKNFGESFLAVLELDSAFVEPSSIDLFLGGQDYYGQYKALAERLTLAQSLEFSIPSIYEVVVPKAEQKDVNSLKKQALTSLGSML